MALTVLIIACFLFYLPSKYFPLKVNKPLAIPKRIINSIASVGALLSLFIFTFSFDFPTALIIWLTAFMTLLSAIIISLKVSKQWVWVWGVVSLLFIIIDFI